MGFDLFLAAMSIVAASIATWALLRLFPSSDARQAIPLRTDGGFADPSHTTDGGVTIDGKVTADGESASDIDGQPTDHLGKRLVIALILTIPTFVITLLALAKIAMPGWLTNPWPHAIVITPVMFYCAAPIHHRGLPALQRRHPNGDSLVSLGMAIVYAYSLLLCVVRHVLCLYPSPSTFGLYLRFGADIADYFAGHIGVRNIYIGEVFGDTSQRYARVEALRDDVPYGEFQFSPVNHGIEQPDSRE